MKKYLKKTAIILAIIFMTIQFIAPPKNSKINSSNQHISKVFAMPTDVELILKKSCYDCHSNNTQYPWYNNIQPFASSLHNHIIEGKDEINFDEFATYKPRRQYKKMKEIIEQLQTNEMPLFSYTLLHGDAKLSTIETTKIINWATKNIDSLTAHYPIDSLVRKK
jgi:Haem-binding domain